MHSNNTYHEYDENEEGKLYENICYVFSKVLEGARHEVEDTEVTDPNHYLHSTYTHMNEYFLTHYQKSLYEMARSYILTHWGEYSALPDDKEKQKKYFDSVVDIFAQGFMRIIKK